MYIQRIGILSQSQSAWTPLSISGCTAWYGDYVNGGTLRTTLSNGANINQWDDLSGRAIHIGSKIGQPVYNSSKTAVKLVAGASLYANVNVINSTSNITSTIFYAWGHNNDDNTDTYQFWIGGANGSAGTYYAMCNRPTSNTTNQQGGDGQRIFPGGIGKNVYVIQTFNMTGNNYTNLTYRKNAAFVTPTAAGSNSSTINLANKIILGGYMNGTTPTTWNSGKILDLMEFIVYNRSLNSTEVSTVETYLNSKYAIY